MIARFHYDEETLDRLLHDSLRNNEQEVAEHVETCEVCQEKIDTLSRQGLSWDEVADLLVDAPVVELAKSFGNDSSEPKVLATFATFLQPTAYLNSLGRFARFEIMEILGCGGLGIVMRGYDTSLERHCAVKVLAPELATSAAARKRFSREAKSAAAVVHRHVVPIQTVDEHDGLPYLVMPVVEGRSLQQRVERDGPLSLIETVRISMQVAEGLAAAHSQGLVHRDIKPANILLENGVERVQITDFGLARAVDDASMTRSGVIAGTPQYMSPEQAHGDEIDHRSDLFSLGSVMYFMLTGRSPFRAETTMGVLNRIGNDEPRSLRGINPEVPDWMEQIVDKLLSKSPEDRYQTATEVAALLQEWNAHLQQPEVVQRPPEPTALAAGSATLPIPAASADGSRIYRWLIGLAMFGFFSVAGTIILLETSKGTLRIESNSDAKIPIVIRKGERIVDVLTASQEGASTRLTAGQYVIEIAGEDAPYAIKGSVSSHLKLNNKTAAGMSTYFRDAHRRTYDFQIELTGNVVDLISDALPRQLSHLVIAERLESSFRWADTGTSLLAESQSTRKSNWRKLVELSKQGKLMELTQLLTLTEYPIDTLPMYLQSMAFCEFVIDRWGRRELLDFAAKSPVGMSMRPFGTASLDELTDQFNTWMTARLAGVETVAHEGYGALNQRNGSDQDKGAGNLKSPSISSAVRDLTVTELEGEWHQVASSDTEGLSKELRPGSQRFLGHLG